MWWPFMKLFGSGVEGRRDDVADTMAMRQVRGAHDNSVGYVPYFLFMVLLRELQLTHCGSVVSNEDDEQVWKYLQTNRTTIFVYQHIHR